MAFEAVAQLRSKGLHAQRLADGFPEWKSAGLPVEVGQPPRPCLVFKRMLE
jgi:rhodanese-related sulfurtransferase